MRRPKEYRPRKGMVLEYGRRVGPPAGFIGGGPIQRTRQGKLPTDQLIFTGSIMRSLKGPDGAYDPYSSVILTSSLYLEGSISMGRSYEKKKHSSVLLGLPTITTGPARASATVVDAIRTGSFTSPSLSHASIGFNDAYVGNSLSSSYIETRTLNLFNSGSAPLENSAVPASASLFYAKRSTLQTIIVKHTASFFDTIPGPSGTCAPTTFVAGSGALCNRVTGSGVPSQGCSVNNPASIFISVPVSGRLVDIKVWVELIHGSGTACLWPLAELGVALRSPTLGWGHAHPIYNDPTFRTQAGFDTYPTPYPNFYRDTFLLWEGGGMGPFNNPVTPGPDTDGQHGQNSQKYPSWDRDRGMRTIFTDGASVPNPRHLYNSTSPSGNFIGAPNSYTGVQPDGSDALIFNCAFGFDVPWTSDKTVQPGTAPYQAVGSPPKGWLNGPGGVADTNEWPTTGVNYGTNQLRPIYPILDPIFIKKSIGNERTSYSNQAGLPPPTPNAWRGFRPGLRGSEISGSWQLLLTNNVGGFNPATDVMQMYFRQVRLEITYESGLASNPGVIRRSETKRKPRRDDRENFLYAISGSDASHYGAGTPANIDWFKTLVYTRTPTGGENGRTFGIVLNSGSFNPDYALLYRLSGNLATISGSAPGWLLNNFTGMPSIPQSSGSLLGVAPDTSPQPPIIVRPPQIVFNPPNSISVPTTLKSSAGDISPPKKLTQLSHAFVSGTAR